MNILKLLETNSRSITNLSITKLLEVISVLFSYASSVYSVCVSCHVMVSVRVILDTFVSVQNLETVNIDAHLNVLVLTPETHFSDILGLAVFTKLMSTEFTPT